jgi:hypothetical protein
VVQNGERLGGSVVQGKTLKARWDPHYQLLPFFIS